MYSALICLHFVLFRQQSVHHDARLPSCAKPVMPQLPGHEDATPSCTIIKIPRSSWSNDIQQCQSSYHNRVRSSKHRNMKRQHESAKRGPISENGHRLRAEKHSSRPQSQMLEIVNKQAGVILEPLLFQPAPAGLPEKSSECVEKESVI